jgi:hypothetical protein
LLQDTKPWQAQTAFQPERLAARRGKAETVEDVVELTPSPASESAEPLDLSSLDLPDLDLSDSKSTKDADAAGEAND